MNHTPHQPDPRPRVPIISTGAANLASVAAAIGRLGAAPIITRDPDAVREAPLVVLPGVGAFGPAMDSLQAAGLDAALRDRIRRSRPLLAICLGLQLLTEASDESPGAEGLGVIPARIQRFTGPSRVPQMGWNLVSPVAPPSPRAGEVPREAQRAGRRGSEGPGLSDAPPLLHRPAHYYFANSFRLPLDANTSASLQDQGWNIALSDHDGPFVAALQRGPVLACQFHPELSGPSGLDLIRGWMALASRAAQEPAPC